jgi:tryptophanyl-tRNA synthetase
MTQFKCKSESNSQGSAAASTALLTYPVLQAADILLCDINTFFAHAARLISHTFNTGMMPRWFL